jgi:hypothetical protein
MAVIIREEVRLMGNPDTCGPLRPGLLPDAADDGDVEWAEYVGRLDREAAAGARSRAGALGSRGRGAVGS